MTTTAPPNVQAPTTERVLCMAFELREKTWQLGCTIGPGQKPRERAVAARHQARVLQEIAQAKRRCGLPETAPVVSCYEAGREGFWLHRFLQAQGLTNYGGDSSAIAVNRRKRRAKSDGVDVRQLVRMLRRYAQGEGEVWRVVHVPSGAAEEQRHLPRALETLKQARASTTTRIKGWRSSQGVKWTSLTKWPAQLEAVRRWDGSALPRGRRRRVLRGWAHHEFLRAPLAALEAERRALLHTSQAASLEQVRQLRQLRGLGIKGAGGLVREFFAWREWKKRRAVGG